MDNNPTPTEPVNQPVDAAPAEPAPVAPAPAPEPAPAPQEPAPATEAPETAEATPKKRSKKPLIVTLIVFIILLLCGGGFAAFAIIKNQPDNVARDAMNNFFNAKRIKVSGSTELSVENASAYGIKSLGVDFDASAADSNHTTSATLRIGLTDGNEITLASIGETMLENGTFYLKLADVKKTYDNYVKDIVAPYIESAARSIYYSSVAKGCNAYITDYSTYLKCYSSAYNNIDASVANIYIASYTKKLSSATDEVLSYIDGRWFEISISDIMNDEMIAEIGGSINTTATTEYECLTDKLNNFNEYSEEFSKLYDQNSFVVLKPTDNSFYKVTFDSKKLADYTNSAINSKFYKDIASCATTVVSTEQEVPTITSDDIAKVLEYLPDISAKFDGFLSHQLSELKITKNSDYYSVSSDFKFSYPNNINITAPEESTPIMDLVRKVYEIAATLTTL